MIGILNAYHFDPTPGNFQEDYNKLIVSFVQNIFPSEKIHNYKIALGAQGEWPKSVDECRLWIITGSAKSAYDLDPWITQLKNFVVQLNQQKKKLIGICFGHQLIAEALNGRVENSAKGWGVGVKNFEIIKKRPWMQPEKNKVALLFSHQDQVVQLPPGAELIAQDEFCPNQMFQIGDHILTLQGHPEFDVKFAKDRLISRKEKVNPETYHIAMNSFDKPQDNRVLAEWIRNFAQPGVQPGV